MSNGHTSKCSAPYWSNPPFLICYHSHWLWRSRLSARVPECQKIKKDGLDQYGAERFGRLIFATVRKSVGLKGLTMRWRMFCTNCKRSWTNRHSTLDILQQCDWHWCHLVHSKTLPTLNSYNTDKHVIHRRTTQTGRFLNHAASFKNLCSSRLVHHLWLLTRTQSECVGFSVPLDT